MKYALILGLVLLVVWLWRSGRQASQNDKKPSPAPQKPAAVKKATEIVECQLCHVHLPRDEALPGRRGLYCSGAHKQLAGD